MSHSPDEPTHASASAPTSAPEHATPDDLMRLADEARRLFHRFKYVADALHDRNSDSASGRRGILRALERLGPSTVPELARDRPVSRQHIQTLVNPMIEDGLVAVRENPAHRRSPHIVLTDKGRAELAEIIKRERRLVQLLRAELSAEEIARSAALLETFRQRLERPDVEVLIHHLSVRGFEEDHDDD